MTDCMIDLETVGTAKDACVLTIAAQIFDPLGNGHNNRYYYVRVDIDSQPERSVDQSTIEWWTRQPQESFQEAFNPDNRVTLKTALEQLTPMLWQSQRIWANGITFDINILEDAYKSYQMPLPWQYHRVRDARTIYALHPELVKPPASHHALEDCRRQIELLQKTLSYLGIKKIH